jgi:hypothetical protein
MINTIKQMFMHLLLVNKNANLRKNFVQVLLHLQIKQSRAMHVYVVHNSLQVVTELHKVNKYLNLFLKTLSSPNLLIMLNYK